MANLTTRTVRVFEVPRSLLAQFLQRAEATQVGVYYLFGSKDDETPQCYIGQSGNVGARLQQHTTSKDFWTRAMVAVSLTNEWTSTHAAYLEWLSLARAKTAGRYTLVNGNQASNPFTPEPLEADCQEFIETIAVLLATLGAPVLEAVKPSPAVAPDSLDTENTPEELFFRDVGCEATGYQTSEGLLVLAGSRGRSVLRPSAPTTMAGQRDNLEAEGVIKVEGDELVFLKDHLFTSPSAAGSLLVGGTNNGRTSWHNAKGQSINVLEQLSLSSTGQQHRNGPMA
ncbi:GIY-YIG nuclease family protein [Mycolicibacterium frederiksbergense]|uniref:GIY-YIG nuclease family protein n=1 Tax=Mycolicibacterium frederiksbergense TaxID=117567 RepID=UPI002473EDD1|nr:GIY-YIG nuclease family protein [Mycolicibacterium frederiksbergense]